MRPGRVLVVYPSNPERLGQTLKESSQQIVSLHGISIGTWEQIDAPGRFIIDGILDAIDNSEFVVADITRLNFNVTFEVGYAIGKNKRVILIVNKALNPEKREIEQLGVYDTLGYREYENSEELRSIITSIDDTRPLRFTDYDIERKAPIYILETLHKTDSSIRIISKIKKSRIGYTSHDPKEQPRLSTLEAYQSIKKSIAVLIHLLSKEATDYYYNNLRGAFLAGLSRGLKKETLILQEGDEPVPIDYRDFVSVYRNYSDIDRCINDLALKITDILHSIGRKKFPRDKNFLANIDLGSSAAENEMTKLESYYVNTDEYKQVLDGNSRLAVGRKGSGKTALFFQARDQLRRDRRKVVLDLKPEGHQLKRFKDLVLNNLNEAIQEHVATAFWEYVLLLEICYKILEKDKQTSLRDRVLFERYQILSNLYTNDSLIGEADFSERILLLVNRISEDFKEISPEGRVYLRSPQVTEMIYKHDITTLRKHIAEYLKKKEGVVILFDNIDKGWPTRGIESVDIIILRSLLDAIRNLERFFNLNSIDFQSTIFIRNDVFEFLVDESPDRGKESKVSLDWTDTDLLREFIRKRLVYNGILSNSTFDEAWNTICVSHINGENSADFLIERSLMRPRNLLNLVNYCKSNAVNLQHEKVVESDIIKAFSNYSSDIFHEIGLEIRDIFPKAEDILYCFIGAKNYISLDEIYQHLEQSEIGKNSYERIVELLMWFSFLGVVAFENNEPTETYIYDVHYDIKKLKVIAKNLKNRKTIFSIHCAFWPFLEISVVNHRKWASYTPEIMGRKNSKKGNDRRQLGFNFKDH